MNKKFDIAEEITGRLMEEMRRTNLAPWQKPWQTVFYQNAITGHKYRGVNVLMIALFGTDTHFLTYNQARHSGGFIRKGAKSLPIVFWSPFERVDAKTGEKKKSFFLKYFNVFPLTDLEGATIERKGIAKIAFNPIEKAEEIAKACGVPIVHGGDRACYSPATHTIRMPAPESFKSVAHYYLTLFHEIIHAMSKENGEKLDCHFGNEAYSKEELTAEIGANFLASYCGIDTSKLIENSASYLTSWLSKLGQEPKLIVSASGKAHKRFDIILKKLGVQTEETEAPEENAIAA